VLCPLCRTGETRVVDSRDDETTVRRRRECQACHHRFTSYERIEAARLSIIKKDGRREPYSREKVRSGVRKACEKRPISEAAIEQIVDDAERELYARGESEIPASTVGELLMAALKNVDKVAYIRFASVYRSFTDVQSFQEELAQLLPKAE
jgi:transcriptional repressor NrdR